MNSSTPSNYGEFAQYIKPVRSRAEIIAEYGSTDKQFKRKLKHHEIVLPPGGVYPKEQYLILLAFGSPPVKEKK